LRQPGENLRVTGKEGNRTAIDPDRPDHPGRRREQGSEGAGNQGLFPRATFALTNLPAKKATAVQVANLYQKRWRIENRFYEVTQTWECEPNTLGYPQAALFAFCLAMVAANGVALIRASLRAVHDPEAVANMSNHYMAKEIRQVAAGMLIVLPADEWQRFGTMSPAQLARALRDVAIHVKPAHYQKAKRGPKKPPPSKGKFQSGAHVSTYKLIKAGK